MKYPTHNTLVRAVAAAPEWEAAELVTVEGVEIVQTGIEYPLASGPHTFTEEDLADAVEAQDDPAIKAPRLRLGHEGLVDPQWDGEPAIGTVANMRLEQNGHLIVGDYVGVPEWLAAALPSAYPGRSIDGEIGVATNTGHNWRLVITGLALLGVRWPGVSTLEDIKALYSKDGPDSVVIYSTEEVDDLGLTAAGRPKVVEARVNVDDIQRAFYNDENLGGKSFWYWVRGMYQEPDELIYEDEMTGDLFRVPYEVNGTTREVTFGDPVAVFEEFIDKPQEKEDKAAATTALMAIQKYQHKTAVVWANRSDSRKDSVVAGEAATAPTIDPKALRALVGLGDDATDEALNSALEAAGIIYSPTGGGARAAGAEAPGTTDSGTSQTGNSGVPDLTGPSGDNKNDPAVAAPTQSPVTAGVRTLDEATYQGLVSDAALGRAAYTRQQEGDRDKAISGAIAEGRIPKSREQYWRGQWDADPEGTKTLLTAEADKGGLAKGLIPVSETGGTGADLTAGGGQAEADDSYPLEWLPDIAAKKAYQAGLAAAAQNNGLVPPPAHPNAHLMRRGI